MTELPAGWTTTTVGEIARVAYGRDLPTPARVSSGSVPVVGSAGVVGSHDVALVEDPVIVVGRKGKPGSVWLMEQPCWPIHTTYYLRSSAGIDPKYLAYALEHEQLAQYDSSTSVPTLRRQDLELVEITLPPLAEQQLVIAAVEALFSHLDAAQRRLRRADRNLDRLTAAIRDTAFDPSWPMLPLGELGPISTGTTPSLKDPTLWNGPFPFVTPGDISHGAVVTGTTRSLTEEGCSARRAVPGNSVLVTCIGRTIGKSALTRTPVATNQQINSVTPMSDVIDARFLLHGLCGPRGQRLIVDASSSTTMPILNKGRFAKLAFPVPSLEVQVNRVSEIEAGLQKVAATRDVLRRNLSRASRLRHVVLSMSLSGRLVPQATASGPPLLPWHTT